MKMPYDVPKLYTVFTLLLLAGEGSALAEGDGLFDSDKIVQIKLRDRIVFIPHGMDLIFDDAQLGLHQQFKSVVARAVIETVEGQKLYRDRIAQLGQMVYGPGQLAERIRELSRLVRPVARGDFDSAVAQLQRTIQERRKFVVSRN